VTGAVRAPRTLDRHRALNREQPSVRLRNKKQRPETWLRISLDEPLPSFLQVRLSSLTC
jgi:hypothetical protein